MSANKLTSLGMAPELAKVIGGRLYATINALDYGVSEAAPDNTKAIQNAINAASKLGRSLYIPAGVYKYTPPLNIPGPLEIRGDGALPLWGSLDQPNGMNAVNMPMQEPYFKGTVLMPASNGSSAFKCSVAGCAISGIDFAVTFQTPFENTGHMLDYTASPKSDGGPDIGLLGSSWRNVGLYGHDGDHYMFNITNSLYNTFDSCKAFGGGFVNSQSTTMQCGNAIYMRCTNMLITGGKAHGYAFGASGGAITQQLNTLIACQCNSDNQPYQAGITPKTPTGSQNMVHCDANCFQFVFIGQDFETLVGASCIYPSSQSFLDCSKGTSGWSWGGNSPLSATDYFQMGSKMNSGSVKASTTTGTVNFPSKYYTTNGVGGSLYPSVIINGVGVTAKITALHNGDGFDYSLSAPGTFSWIAIGR